MTVKTVKNLRRQKLGEVQGRGPEIEIEQKKKGKVKCNWRKSGQNISHRLLFAGAFQCIKSLVSVSVTTDSSPKYLQDAPTLLLYLCSVYERTIVMYKVQSYMFCYSWE